MYASLQKIVYGGILSTNSRDLGLMTVVTWVDQINERYPRRLRLLSPSHLGLDREVH